MESSVPSWRWDNQTKTSEAYPAGRHGVLEIIPVLETQRLESGGAICNAVRAAGIEGRFLVLNGDIFVDFDLTPAIAEHDARDADLTSHFTAWTTRLSSASPSSTTTSS
jgi:NDP-sugar pyrophosphorylase family protein